MKLQYLMIIFIIIAIPMIILLTYYMSLQRDTLALQASYDTKLIASTKQALEAFEVNTVEWDNGFSNYADSRRRDILASINAFKTSFANSLNLSGLTKESLLTYIPAIMYNLYDGYYIYSPTSVPMTKNNDKGVQLFQDGNSQYATTDAVDKDGNMNKILYIANTGGSTFVYEYLDEDNNKVEESIEGLTTNVNNAKKEYKHTLKNYIQYSEKVNSNVMVGYTLDNYLKVYTQNDEKEGYLINTEKLKRTNNQAPIKTALIKYNEKEIQPEVLSEYIFFIDTDGEIKSGLYNYVYNMYNEKCYYDNGVPFKVINNKRVYLPNCIIGDSNCEYKVLYVATSGTEYIKLYQPINPLAGELNFLYTEEMINRQELLTTEDALEVVRTYELMDSLTNSHKDFSAINYYIQSYTFTNWVNSLNLGDTFTISDENDPENENSLFNIHKKEIMKNSIIGNLNLAISSYSANSSYNYSLPIFSNQEWDQIFSNVSMISFVQGMPIGLKYYNNYTIAMSTRNNEYMNPDEIYYISKDVSDNRFHSRLCEKVEGDASHITGYRNTDFVIKAFETHDSTVHYYKHEKNERCYYCLILRKPGDTATNNLYKSAYLHAIARERYIQKN